MYLVYTQFFIKFNVNITLYSRYLQYKTHYKHIEDIYCHAPNPTIKIGT